MSTVLGNSYLVVLTERFKKLFRTVSSVEAAPYVTRQFLNNWIFSHGSRIHLVSDKCRHFMSRFVQHVSQIIKVHKWLTKSKNQLSIVTLQSYNIIGCTHIHLRPPLRLRPLLVNTHVRLLLPQADLYCARKCLAPPIEPTRTSSNSEATTRPKRTHQAQNKAEVIALEDSQRKS